MVPTTPRCTGLVIAVVSQLRRQHRNRYFTFHRTRLDILSTCMHPGIAVFETVAVRCSTTKLKSSYYFSPSCTFYKENNFFTPVLQDRLYSSISDAVSYLIPFLQLPPVPRFSDVRRLSIPSLPPSSSCFSLPLSLSNALWRPRAKSAFLLTKTSVSQRGVLSPGSASTLNQLSSAHKNARLAAAPRRTHSETALQLLHIAF